MAKRSRAMRNLGSNFESAANSTLRSADKAAAGLARWATTDHSGMSRALSNMPPMGFLDTIKHTSTLFAISLASIVLSGVLMFVLIAFGIPYFLFGHF